MRRFRESWPVDLFDIVAVAGLVILGASLWVISPPLAGAVVAVLMMTWAIVSALPARRE